MKVREIMTTDVRTCGPEATLAHAAMIMWDDDCGVVPVVNGAGQPVGVLTDRDICMALATRDRRASELTAGEVSAGRVRTCRPEDDVADVLAVMRREQLRRLPVTDADGRLVGILSIADIVRHSKKDERKGRYVSHRDVIRTLKALVKPAPPLDEDIGAGAAEAAAEAAVAAAAVADE
ncbi:MAG TPA: CBS domain-containing protein [Pyrinomonadaceae bacterium]|jgi:CBS domain-containing protein